MAVRYFVETEDGSKIYLMELSVLDIPHRFTVKGGKQDGYTWKDLKIEPREPHACFAGAVIGGLVGLLFGPIGVLVGSMIGALLGAAKDKEGEYEVIKERKRLEVLNEHK